MFHFKRIFCDKLIKLQKKLRQKQIIRSETLSPFLNNVKIMFKVLSFFCSMMF